jgi:pseudaminic acid cytidylyltransferase
VKLAVIPARGGSKRIPRKNIKDFLGKPIIAYSIEACIASGLFDDVIVSTDDAEIADVARSYGASVPFMRPAELANDHEGTAAVVKHALHWFADNASTVAICCCVYATAPFVRARDLVAGLNILEDTQKDYAFSVASFDFPVQRALHMTVQGMQPLHPEFAQTRSQDLVECFHDAGQFYWGRAHAYLNDIPLFSPASAPVHLPRYRVQDIDSLEDWKRAEAMFMTLKSQGL